MWAFVADGASEVATQPGTTTTAILVAALSSVAIAFIGAYYRRGDPKAETEPSSSPAEAELATKVAVHEYRLDDLTRRVSDLERDGRRDPRHR